MKKLKIIDSPAKAKSVVPKGSLKKIITKNYTLCLAHTKDGFFAIEDACPHMHASLSKGRLNSFHEVICPLHSYRFDLSSGTECQNRSRDARTFKVLLNEEGLFIFLPD